MLAGVAWSHPSSCSKADCDGPKGQKDNMIDAGIIYFTLKSLKAKRRYTCTLANAALARLAELPEQKLCQTVFQRSDSLLIS